MTLVDFALFEGNSLNPSNDDIDARSKLSHKLTLATLVYSLWHEVINPPAHCKYIGCRNYSYSHLSKNCWGWNKSGVRAKAAKSINVDIGINVEVGIFWKKLVHRCNKHGVEGGKNLRNTWRVEMCVEDGFFFSKSISVTLRLLGWWEYASMPAQWHNHIHLSCH